LRVIHPERTVKKMIPRTNQEASQSEACQTPRPVRRPEATGLRNPQASYYRARYYDALSGRFLREDPLRFGSGDPNFYSYVSQNPTNYTDPFGKTRIYGNWCGPNWTGGLVDTFDPRHVKDYEKPIDKIDEVCQRHDICYFNCRKGKPCDPDARLNCFKYCDQVFVQEMPDKEKFWPTILDSGINLDRILGNNPEDNAPGCCKPKTPPSQSPAVDFPARTIGKSDAWKTH
jgi:RHS repeat-associated protein